MIYTYTDDSGRLHIFANYEAAFDAWAADDTATFAGQPSVSGVAIVDHRPAPTVTSIVRERTAAVRAAAEGSFEHFVSLGQ